MPVECVDMLRESIPHALGAGSAKDERHGYQTTIANLVGDVLQAVVRKWEEKVQLAASNCESIDSAKAAQSAVLEAAQSELDARCSTVKDKQEALEAAK